MLIRIPLMKNVIIWLSLTYCMQRTGLSRFNLEFHLPYYTWRTSDHPIKDRRNYAEDPLRHTRDVSVMCWDKSKPSKAYLSEAQISCVVAGIDDCRWEAYCFVDTYFDSDERKESVLKHDEEANESGSFRADPLTKGRQNADSPLPDPRVYFLRVFCIRLQQVEVEWQNVKENLSQSTRRYFEVGRPVPFSSHIVPPSDVCNLSSAMLYLYHSPSSRWRSFRHTIRPCRMS